MRALIFDKSKSDWDSSTGFELAQVPKPELEAGDHDSVIVKVEYAGVCGTDRGLWYRSAFRDQILSTIDSEEKEYRIFGHELFGEVIETGKNVAQKFGIKTGDKVSADSHVVCNECFQCKNGQKNVCTNEIILGVTRDGVFAEYVKLPAHDIWKVNIEKIRPEVAAIQDPFGNAVHAATKVELRDKTLLISGLGPIALFLILIAKAQGAKKIIGVDPDPEAIKTAKLLGVETAIKLETKNKSPKHDEQLVRQVMEQTDNQGVDLSIEMAGANSSFNNCLFSTRRGGDVILFGLKNGDFMIEDYNTFIFNGLTLHAVIGREIWKTWETAKAILENRSNGVQDHIFDTILKSGKGSIIPIDEFDPKVFEEKMKKYPKLIIKF